MVKDLNAILDHVQRLNELDTSNVEPMAQLCGTALRPVPHDAMREDKAGPSLAREAVMENAPETDGAFFKVPKVIEK
jgi:aspartyl-tRNA(Asn)/glutamyl-tRNA(Gln) amidotransferase subunit C